MNNANIELVADVAAQLAGMILANGGETSRAEETAGRIASAFDCHMDVIALPTGLTMTVSRDSARASTIIRVGQQRVDLNMLEKVNAISRELTEGRKTLPQAREELKKLKNLSPPKDIISVLAAGGSAAMFSLMFGGGWFEFVTAGAVCALIQILLNALPESTGTTLKCFITGVLSAALALAACTLKDDANVSLAVWSITMPHLPGLAFTNGIRDAMHGDMVSGGARLTDAVMRALVLAGGAGMVIWCYLRLGGVSAWLM